MIYSTLPHALSDTRPHLECCKSCTTQPQARINWLIVMSISGLECVTVDMHARLRFPVAIVYKAPIQGPWMCIRAEPVRSHGDSPWPKTRLKSGSNVKIKAQYYLLCVSNFQAPDASNLSQVVDSITACQKTTVVPERPYRPSSLHCDYVRLF